MYVILVGSCFWVVQFSLMSCHQNTKGADILRLVWYKFQAYLGRNKVYLYKFVAK